MRISHYFLNVLTTSERGPLLRVWDTSRERHERELERGVYRADMWGVKFEDGLTAGDKGTDLMWSNA